MTAAELFANLAIPIIQAPMLGASGPAIALAVTRAGGMGSLAAGALAPEDIAQQIAALKAATDRPFGVNLLIARPATPDPATVIEALERLAPWYDCLGIELPAPPNDYAPDFDAQFAALLAAAPPLALALPLPLAARPLPLARWPRPTRAVSSRTCAPRCSLPRRDL